MAKVLCYTSTARGHLYPTVPVLLELLRRGQDVALLTLEAEVARMNAAGLRARRIAPEIRGRRASSGSNTLRRDTPGRTTSPP